MPVAISVITDDCGNWIAFGRSDNNSQENYCVNNLLALRFLHGTRTVHTVEIHLPEMAPQ